jgi:putative transposase
MLRAYKYRLLPNLTQQTMMGHHFGCCRMVWNLALSAKKAAYETAQINISRYDLQKQLIDLKKEYPWLYEVNAQSLQSVLLNLDNAYKSFFKGGGFPRFKSKKGYSSFQCPQNVKVIGDSIQLPKIGKVSFINSRKFEGKIKTVTISKTPTGKYYASILVDNEKGLPIKTAINPHKTIGIDVGIKSFAICSDGRSFEPNRKLKENLKRLQCLQCRASRKKKGSNNRKKANKCVAILHERIKNQRVDYCHKVTTGLIRDNQAETFVIEDLAVVNMLKNRKLSQAISDVSFGEFFRQLKYKCEWSGKNLIVINRFDPSSKRCSDCGEINQELTLADREWTCTCGIHHDRDLNAAKNIKYFGLQQTIFKKKTPEGIGEEPVESRRLRRAKKQEISN